MPIIGLELLFVLLWSSGFIGAKYGLPYAGPFTLLLIRYAIVAGLLGGWLLTARRFSICQSCSDCPSRRHWSARPRHLAECGTRGHCPGRFPLDCGADYGIAANVNQRFIRPGFG
jgi:drug/metabolite transporter (DMT)-like permease